MCPLEDIVEYGQHLPPFPKVITELLSTFRREDCTADEIARIVSSDAVLSARILRLANSAFYRRSRSVSSVKSATVIVGYVPLRLLVASLGVAGGVPMPKGLDRKRFWRYSLHTGVLARQLVQRVGGDPETAFSGGLLHAVGHPIMRAAMAEACDRLEETTPFYARDRAAREREHWGFDYSQIGEKLAEQWGFPAQLVVVIRDSADPLGAAEFSTTAGCVRLAAEMASGLEQGLAQAETIAFVDPKLLFRLKLTPNDVRTIPPVAELTAGMESLVQD